MQGTILDMITGINNKYGEDLFKKNVKPEKTRIGNKKRKVKNNNNRVQKKPWISFKNNKMVG